MNRILATGGMAMVALTLAACSGAYPGSSNSYAAVTRNAATGTDASVQALQGQPCPGTNEAGGAWHPGGYCLPGGR